MGEWRSGMVLPGMFHYLWPQRLQGEEFNLELSIEIRSSCGDSEVFRTRPCSNHAMCQYVTLHCTCFLGAFPR